LSTPLSQPSPSSTIELPHAGIDPVSVAVGSVPAVVVTVVVPVVVASLTLPWVAEPPVPSPVVPLLPLVGSEVDDSTTVVCVVVTVTLVAVMEVPVASSAQATSTSAVPRSKDKAEE
jgi:hypothetical protein